VIDAAMATANVAPEGFMFDPQAERMAREDLAALQLARLRATLDLAYSKVAHVRAKFDAAGVQPGQLKSLADIVRFPFSTKADLRDNYPFGLFAVPREQLVRIHASSGTTGKATIVGYTADDLELWTNLMARSIACAGARPGDVLHNAYGYGLFTGGLGFHYGAERLGCTVVPVSGGMTERQVTLLQDLRANILCATPSYALNIAEVAHQMGVDIRKLPLRFGIFGAEPWSEAMRADLETRIELKAIDCYGLSEIIGPGVAVECHEAQNGLHGWEDHFLFEVIDHKTLEPVPAGEAGELVITTLSKQALPMVRYRTRDITRLAHEPCQCGRTHVRIMRVTGRDDDMLIIRGVNVFPSQVESVLVGLPGVAPHYQILLVRDGSLDAITLEVEVAPGMPADEASRSRIAGDVARHLKENIGLTCGVVVKAPGEIPRSQGKAVRVKDLRTKPGA
jgi:phenylacetate-CoA ligase